MPRDAAAVAQLDALGDELPDGWTETVWTITETTLYDVVVRHPIGAPVGDQAGAAYAAYCAADHPAEVFAHQPMADEISLDGDDIEATDGWIAWHTPPTEQRAA